MPKQVDAIVIGSGPNGLAAAITLARAGLSVVVYEAKKRIGGGMRSSELTLPGFVHDICSAIHPLAISSPFFQSIPLEVLGFEWIHPPTPLAHPFLDGKAALLENSIELTAKNLGVDGEAYTRLMKPLVEGWEKFGPDVLAPFHFPRHPFQLMRFTRAAVQAAEKLWNKRFKEREAKGLFAGLAGHSLMSLDRPLTAAFALVLGIQAHLCGWPFPKGGAQKIADALAAYFRSLGGEIATNAEVKSLDELPKAKLILCDISPKQLITLAGNRLPESYKRKLEKFRYGSGVFKLDWALEGPIPWKAEEVKRAGCVHIGGEADAIAAAEKAVCQKKHSERPFLILAQQSLFDPTRAPEGKHTAWAYCHVPPYSEVDMTEEVENQIERFAPGFKECILARSKMNTRQMENYNPNYIGGDINGGVQDIKQLFTRPVHLFSPYSTPHKGLYLCSSSTPPGGGVHGMCGYHAAKLALKQSGIIAPAKTD
ncbi:MAG: NAD(P)/FAD-dependent oxidoreductase [Chlamydiales bacterium]|nr:NAD(P)/FAD-dependent oxidoreductase [Chlamydiales bacterium]